MNAIVDSQEVDYRSLNAELNLLDADGKIQFGADKEAARQYFLQHVNQNTVFFHNLKEKIDYLIENKYYDSRTFAMYSFDFIKSLYKFVYGKKYRFKSFMGAYKFYTGYAQKTFDNTRYVERFEDRICAVALHLAMGDKEFAMQLAEEMISGRYQPATPTFLNSGKAQRGELVSCFLLRIEDNMDSIGRSINSALQLSKRGGGVALSLSNIREAGAPIKNIQGQSSGIIPIMKLLEDSFSYANQLGARQGSGAVYMSCHHPDILSFLDTKRENADEKIRIKTLSLGVVVSDVAYEAAGKNEDLYLFSPYDINKVYGKPLGDINVTEMYHELIDNPKIKKTRINARLFFQRIAEIQFESGYPYVLNEDVANRAHPNFGRVNMSNLCVTGDSQILTDKGYRNVKDLYETQEPFDVIVDDRARDMNISVLGTSQESSTKMFRTAQNVAVFKLTTRDGYEIRATAWHKFYVVRNGEFIKIPLNDVQVQDKLLVQSAEGAFGDIFDVERATQYALDVCSAKLDPNTLTVPSFILHGDKETQLAFLETLCDKKNSTRPDDEGWIETAHPNKAFLVQVQRLWLNLGKFSTIQKHRIHIGDNLEFDNHVLTVIKSDFLSEVVNIKADGVEDVYDVTVENGHSVIFNGIATGNCSEILQTNSASVLHNDLSYEVMGQDISCNLGSMNIASVMDNAKGISDTVEIATRALTAVSLMTKIDSVPSVVAGNDAGHSIGLGQMNLHGYLARERILYGSVESLDFTNLYFATINFHSIRASNQIAIEQGQSYTGFHLSKYASGEYFTPYVGGNWTPKTQAVRDIVAKTGWEIPTNEDWMDLMDSVQKYGLFNSYRLAVPPTGSISYVNNSTASIHPIAAKIEVRKEAKLGRVYYPAAFMDNTNLEFYKDAYEIGPEAIIDVYAEATKHTDQGLSLTLFFKGTATTRDINRAQIYAWKKNIKTIYYIRLRQDALEGTEVNQCASCVV